MATERRYGVPINLKKFELRNSVLQVLGTAPGSPITGLQYYDSATGQPLWYNAAAGAWANLATDSAKLNNQSASYYLSRANHTGSQLAGTISNFDTQVRTNRLEQLTAPNADVNMNSRQFSSLGAASQAGQALEYAQALVLIDAVRQGVRAKDSVTYVATGNVTLSGLGTQAGGDWGGTMTAGQSVLVTNNTDPKQNGPYTVAAGAWVRRLADDTGAELVPGSEWFVELGALLAASKWVLRNVTNPVVGTDNITITQTGASVSYTGSTSVQVSGGTISAIVEANGGVVAGASGLKVDTAVVTRKYSPPSPIGDGTAVSFTITHNLGTRKIIARVWETTSPYDEIDVGVDHTTINTCTINFAEAPSVGQYDVVVMG